MCRECLQLQIWRINRQSFNRNSSNIAFSQRHIAKIPDDFTSVTHHLLKTRCDRIVPYVDHQRYRRHARQDERKPKIKMSWWSVHASWARARAHDAWILKWMRPSWNLDKMLKLNASTCVSTDAIDRALALDASQQTRCDTHYVINLDVMLLYDSLLFIIWNIMYYMRESQQII